eukprot:XP_016862009.1 protein SSUH2 homolog isoform X5 [Homo sapiens]
MVDLHRFLVITVHAGHAVEQLTLAGTAKQVWWTSVLRPRVLWRPPQSSWRDCPAMTGFFKGAEDRYSSHLWRPQGGPRSKGPGPRSWNTGRTLLPPGSHLWPLQPTVSLVLPSMDLKTDGPLCVPGLEDAGDTSVQNCGLMALRAAMEKCMKMQGEEGGFFPLGGVGARKTSENLPRSHAGHPFTWSPLQEMPSPVGLLRALPLPWPQFLACTLRRLAGPRESTGPSQKPPPLCSVPCRVPAMTEEVAREALLSFVDSKCCYSSTVAGDLVIQELKRQTLCRYRLETFSESRISEWTFQPFTNHSVDGPQRGASPRLWDIKVQGPPMFQEDTRKFQVPHSSLVKECHKCHGRGRYKCSGCHGAGTVRCPSCCGAKRKAKQSRRCQLCAGSGRRRCSTCSGRGNKTCATCKGEKKLLHFIQLVIMWKNSLFEFVSEHRLNCPRELLAKAKGENLFKDENSVVYPIVDFPLRDISLASQRGIAEHSAALASRARVLQQRQTIELIPLTEVHYWYQGKTYVYYIYGTDHQVYAVDYPERYCCGCTIV